MNCYDAIDLMGGAVEGHLPSAARPGFEGHLVECGPCRHYFDQLSFTVRALERLPEPPGSTPDAEQREALRRAFRARSPRADG